MNFELWMSRRLRLSKDAPTSTVTGVVIAVVGVALALIIMELSVAISLGFKHEIRRKVAGFEAPVSIAPTEVYEYDEQLLRLNDSLLNCVKSTLPDARLSATTRRHAILKTDSDFIALQCIAHSASHDDSFERENLVSGSWLLPDSASHIVISSQVASRIGLRVGDKVYAYFFVNGKIKPRRLSVTALYNSHFSEYDGVVAYTSPALMASLAADSTLVTSLDIEGISIDQVDPAAHALTTTLLNAYQRGDLPEMYTISTINDRGALYFNWLDLLDTNVVVIFVLMLAVAGFTLISSLFIIILDRVSTIGVLRALGLSSRRVSLIFLNLAMKLVGLGMLIGNVVGLGLILLQYYTRIMPLDPEMYYLSYVPVDLSWWSFLALNIGVAIVAWLVLYIPARLAARIDPSASIRYE